jgi:hypothetical protein
MLLLLAVPLILLEKIIEDIMEYGNAKRNSRVQGGELNSYASKELD